MENIQVYENDTMLRNNRDNKSPEDIFYRVISQRDGYMVLTRGCKSAEEARTMKEVTLDGPYTVKDIKEFAEPISN